MTDSPSDIPSGYDVGPVEAFDETPEPVTIEGRRFFVVREGADFALYSSECPHRGGPVYLDGDHFECAIHGWKFDVEDGRRLGGGPGRMHRTELVRHGNRLVAPLSSSDLEAAHPDHEETDEIAVVDGPGTPPDELDVTPETTVGSILETHGPPARRVLADYGMRCLGCALAATESLEAAADTHRLPPDEFRELLERLQELDGD